MAGRTAPEWMRGLWPACRMATRLDRPYNIAILPQAPPACGSITTVEKIMMQKVYLLQHSYELDNGCDATKVLGVFSSEKKAKDAIEMYRTLPGFCEHPQDLYMDPYRMDKGCWTEGYQTLEGAGDCT